MMSSRVSPGASKYLSGALLAAAFLSLPAGAADGVPAADIVKSDGSVARYRLLPVHVDAAHAAEVTARLAQAVAPDASLPASFQIPRARLPKPRDQGQRGTCAYFATVGVVESYYIAQSGANRGGLSVSEECLAGVRDWMYDQGSAYTGSDRPAARPDDSGDFPQSIVLTVAREGIPAARKYANGARCTYDGDETKGRSISLTDYRDIFGQGLSTAYGKGLSFQVSRKPTIDAVRKSIAQGSPVEVGIFFFPEFHDNSHWVYDPRADTNDQIAGGHAILLTGYQTTDGHTTFTFKNSWGELWGDDGFGTLSDTLLTHGWSMSKDFDVTVSLKKP